MLLLSIPPNCPLRSGLISSKLYRSSNYSRKLVSFRSLDSGPGSQFDTIFCFPTTTLTPPSSKTTFSLINAKKNRGLSLPCLCKKSDENSHSPLPPPNVSGELFGVRRVLQRWDVPWPWQTFVLTNIACALSFILIGLAESSVSTYIGFQGSDLSLDAKSFEDQHSKPSNLRLVSDPTWSRGFRAETTSSSNLNRFSNGNVDAGNSTFRTLSPVSSSVIANSAATLSSPLALPLGSKKSVCLFYCEETRELAEKIANVNQRDESIELRSIQWRTFEDGFPNLMISNAHGIRGKHVAFLASFSSPGVIFEQVSIIYALPRLFISSFTVVLPFFPTGTSERMEDEGDIATAFTLSRILSNIPISRGGPTSLVIFDIHALQERFFFGDNVLPCFESGVPLLMNRLKQLPDSDNISIAFPDDGAWKRFHKQLQHFPTIICTKVREGDQRFVRLKEGNPAGRHVVIVDDLVQSGGTLIECQKVLAQHGASKISAYVTHGIFPNKTWQKFQHDNGVGPSNGLCYFWITDSCSLTVKEVKNQPPFEVLSLADSIATTLQI